MYSDLNKMTVPAGSLAEEQLANAGMDYTHGFLRDEAGNVFAAHDDLVERIEEERRIGAGSCTYVVKVRHSE